MKFLTDEETAEKLEGLIHFDTQAAGKGIDLTVESIHKMESQGSIDFGGSEKEDAKLSEIEPEKRNPKDDYGWWDLEPGSFILKYNENLTEDIRVFVQPLPRLIKNMATHPSVFTKELDSVLLKVGGKGIAIKENSRVSRLLIPKY